MIFLLNITKVGDRACELAVNFVIVNIPESVERIGDYAFYHCRGLTTVSFPTTLKSIGSENFENSNLKNVDFPPHKPSRIGKIAFAYCSEIKSMTIPDLLQTLGEDFFTG